MNLQFLSETLRRAALIPRLIDPIVQFSYYSLDEVGFAFSVGGRLPAVGERRASAGASLDASIPIVNGGQPRRRLIDVTITRDKTRKEEDQ